MSPPYHFASLHRRKTSQTRIDIHLKMSEGKHVNITFGCVTVMTKAFCGTTEAKNGGSEGMHDLRLVTQFERFL